MAGIIAQLSRANWERKKNKKRQFPSDKCMTSIDPFGPTFEPSLHNHYLR